MKTTVTTSKTPSTILTIIAVLLGTVTLIKAETFIGPTSPSNRLLIGTNQSVLIDTILYDTTKGWGSLLNANLAVSNVNYSLGLFGVRAYGSYAPTGIKIVPLAISGPAELIFTNSCAIHLLRLTNSSMQMILWGLNSNTVSISVPAGRTIQFFSRVDNMDGAWPLATLSSGTNSFDALISPGDLIEGPINVSFDYARQNFNGFPAAFVSYWFVENVFQNPNTIVSLGAGVPNVVVQKSADLTSWQSVATFPATLGSNSFYRLQISK